MKHRAQFTRLGSCVKIGIAIFRKLEVTSRSRLIALMR